MINPPKRPTARNIRFATKPVGDDRARVKNQVKKDSDDKLKETEMDGMKDGKTNN